MADTWTPGGVRLRLRAQHPGDLDWLFVPGGPGIGSQSLHELVDAIAVPGRSWMVDLPGDGDNVERAGPDPYAAWPQVVVEAAQAVARPVAVGHSTGGEYLLATPALEPLLVGLALVSTAPDARWMATYGAMTQADPLPAVDAAAQRYAAEPTHERLRDLAVASAPWNFTAESLEAGTDLLGRMPYNGPAVDWSDEHFDRDYIHAWFPRALPTLIVSGSADRIVDQSLWDDDRFRGPHVQRRVIDGGAHFPWIERPAAVIVAFAELAERLQR